MGRYYKIEVGPGNPGGNLSKTGGQGVQTASRTWTNQINGRQDMGAQQVEFDIPVSTFATPAGQGAVKIWGVSLQDISQASDYNGAPITVSGGMQKGLPFATGAAGFAGVIVQGAVLQSFGNWMGINQTLDLIVTTDGGATQASPNNIVLVWKKGTALSDAIRQVLTTAYPGYTINVNIDARLKLAQDEAAIFSTLQQFASYLKSMSATLLGGMYPGVDMSLREKTISVYDGSSPVNPINLNFVDMIGQPTWLSPYTIQFNTVMRADIHLGDYVKFPDLAGVQSTTTPQSISQFRDKSTFKGVWQVGPLIRHVGNSRAPDAMSWITTFQAYSAPATQAATSPASTSA